MIVVEDLEYEWQGLNYTTPVDGFEGRLFFAHPCLRGNLHVRRDRFIVIVTIIVADLEL